MLFPSSSCKDRLIYSVHKMQQNATKYNKAFRSITHIEFAKLDLHLHLTSAQDIPNYTNTETIV